VVSALALSVSLGGNLAVVQALLKGGPFNEERCEVDDAPPKLLELPKTDRSARVTHTYELIGVDEIPDRTAIYTYRRKTS
jgi:hypothetical protein